MNGLSLATKGVLFPITKDLPPEEVAVIGGAGQVWAAPGEQVCIKVKAYLEGDFVYTEKIEFERSLKTMSVIATLIES